MCISLCICPLPLFETEKVGAKQATGKGPGGAKFLVSQIGSVLRLSILHPLRLQTDQSERTYHAYKKTPNLEFISMLFKSSIMSLGVLLNISLPKNISEIR
jgi:hypothetical protein